ncbi:transmembrane protein 14C-like [Brevipalpus obovatus]|uniref:transmembrane protein 14C-like n=1 Tax=Brevipalpus obovatus TaxID=246614 RepID=UPI003D9DBA38
MPPRLPPSEGTWATDWIEADLAEERPDNLFNFAVLLEDFLLNTPDNHHTERLRELIVLLSEQQQESSQKMPVDVISSLYAGLVAAGGILGYAKAGSVPSLVAGLFFGTTLGVGAYMTSRDPNNYGLTLGTSTLLSGLMGYRFYNTGKFMPAGLMTILSVAMMLNISYKALSGQQHLKK